MRTNPPKRDWFKTWVHAFFGALLGAVLGFRAWGRSAEAFSTSWLPGVAYIGGGAVLVGVIAAAAAESGWDE